MRAQRALGFGFGSLGNRGVGGAGVGFQTPGPGFGLPAAFVLMVCTWVPLLGRGARHPARRLAAISGGAPCVAGIAVIAMFVISRTRFVSGSVQKAGET